VIEEASDAFLDVPGVVFFPLFTLLFSLPVTVYCLIATLLLISLREVDPNTGMFVYSQELREMIFCQLFGWLWTCWWLASIQFTSVSGACADWYFTPEIDGHKHVAHMPIARALARVLRFHLGTMAVGSFIVAAVQVGGPA
jgi:hypothetical protein